MWLESENVKGLNWIDFLFLILKIKGGMFNNGDRSPSENNRNSLAFFLLGCGRSKYGTQIRHANHVLADVSSLHM